MAGAVNEQSNGSHTTAPMPNTTARGTSPEDTHTHNASDTHGTRVGKPVVGNATRRKFRHFVTRLFHTAYIFKNPIDVEVVYHWLYVQKPPPPIDTSAVTCVEGCADATGISGNAQERRASESTLHGRSQSTPTGAVPQPQQIPAVGDATTSSLDKGVPSDSAEESHGTCRTSCENLSRKSYRRAERASKDCLFEDGHEPGVCLPTPDACLRRTDAAPPSVPCGAGGAVGRRGEENACARDGGCAPELCLSEEHSDAASATAGSTNAPQPTPAPCSDEGNLRPKRRHHRRRCACIAPAQEDDSGDANVAGVGGGPRSDDATDSLPGPVPPPPHARSDRRRRAQLEREWLQMRWIPKRPSKIVLVDARREEEFCCSHIEGAINIRYDKRWVAWRAITRPFHGQRPGEVAADDAIEKLDRDATIIVYCGLGFRSAMLARRIMAHGFARVHVMRGALYKWASLGLPMRDGNGRPSNKVIADNYLATFALNWEVVVKDAPATPVDKTSASDEARQCRAEGGTYETGRSCE